MVTVVRDIGGRYDDRLAAVGDGVFASATDRAVTVWAPDAEPTTVVTDDAGPGPLDHLGAGVLGWGATVLRDGAVAWPVAPLVAAAVADLGEDAVHRFVPALGAVDGAGARVLLVLRRQLPRTQPSHTPPVAGPPARTVVLDARDRRVLHSEDADAPATAVSWGRGPLLLGSVGVVTVLETTTFTPTRHELAGGTAVRALASGDRSVAAGMADGRAATASTDLATPALWRAHDGVVRAVAWAPDDETLATGGDDGRLRIWRRDGSQVDEWAAGDDVIAVCWLDAERMVAKVGGAGGRLVVLSLGR